ncbi:MAG: hypothetical protein ABJM06_02795 [Gilvibacter sp.]
MKRRTIYVAIVLLVVAGIAGYNYMYQDHRDIQKEEAVFKGDAKGLHKLYLESPKEALLNKTVIVTGLVTALEEGGITLDDAVYASYSNAQVLPNLNERVTIKGRCIGYDELFEIVSIDQATPLD